MPTITRLVASKSGKSVRIYIDGRYVFSLSPNEVISQGISKNQTISETRFQCLKQSGDYEKNYLKALNLISYRPRSVDEISQYLKRHSVSAIVISRVITTLINQHYLDDINFALAYARSKISLKHYGPHRLQSDLYSKGISNTIITQTLNTLFPDQDSILSQARQALLKKQKSFRALSSYQLKNKATNYLYRLGYSLDTINQAIASIDE